MSSYDLCDFQKEVFKHQCVLCYVFLFLVAGEAPDGESSVILHLCVTDARWACSMASKWNYNVLATKILEAFLLWYSILIDTTPN